MEDLTLAIVTLATFVLLFVAAIFADRAGTESQADVAELVSVTDQTDYPDDWEADVA